MSRRIFAAAVIGTLAWLAPMAASADAPAAPVERRADAVPDGSPGRGAPEASTGSTATIVGLLVAVTLTAGGLWNLARLKQRKAAARRPDDRAAGTGAAIARRTRTVAPGPVGAAASRSEVSDSPRWTRGEPQVNTG